MVKKRVATSRRSFLSKIWVGLGLGALLQFLAGSVLFLRSGRRAAGSGGTELLEVGMITDFPPGSVTFIAGGHLYLSRLEDGGFLAISRKCTHLGCAVPWIAERKQFECPCHASVFDVTGSVLKSPAPRALDLFSVTCARGRVIVDISSPIRRSTFKAEQVTYPQGGVS